MITISAFKWVPEFAQAKCAICARAGRWRKLVCLTRRASRTGRSGQIGLSRAAALRAGADPEEDGLVLFESGAIVLHIGERSEMLLPKDASERARATQWLIAALIPSSRSL